MPRILFTLLCLLTTTVLMAETSSLTQTKTKLKKLDTQIQQLKQSLSTAEDKRGFLNQKLADNEKKIGESVQKLSQTQSDIRKKQQRINQLEHSLQELNKQLATQQKLLAEHIRIRYKMSEYEPLKWILNQDNPYTITRLLTFHQYLVLCRQKIIDAIAVTKQNITENQTHLKAEIATQQDLQSQLHSRQKKLEQEKNYQSAVIQSLNNDIQSKQLVLSDFERNKKNLSRLLQTLSQQSVPNNQAAFSKMNHKLPKPVHIARSAIKKVNQGILLLASEGTPVYAVYPGKIVFSDWLNGYGLLIIIDHGKGFMTLYAHNQSLFKHKGEIVQQNQQIAAVGHTGGTKQNGLYFEVRQSGKAVSPLEWLA